MSEYKDMLDDIMFESIEQMPGDWEPLVTGPEAWLIGEEEEESEDLWEAMANAYVNHATVTEDEQAETFDLLSLFA